MADWVEEKLHKHFRASYEVSRVLYKETTGHQSLVVFENPTFGRMLSLDSVTQTTEADEFIYHEMLTHVPILAHGRVRRVLIVGGGDGGMLEEVLKHKSVEHVTMVEIDAGVVEFSKKHLPSICKNAFEDPRLNLVIADGAEFAARRTGDFDVAIIDSTDPMGPGEVLFTAEFYANTKACLTPGGVIVTQNGVPFMQAAELKGTVTRFRKLFADAGCYLCTVPSYVGGPMALGWGTDDASLRKVSEEELDRRFRAAGFDTRYYTPAVHKGAFALPRYILDILG